MINVLIVFGTRPEAIKMAPFISKSNDKLNFKVCVTGQHREMLDQVLELFDISPDYDLNIMKPGQDLFDVSVSILNGMKKILDKESPDIVLIHGDTTTSMVAAMAAFYMGIPVGHVEAGLRTYNLKSPFPEELNRQLTSRIADFHFAPTANSRKNLLNEKISDSKIYVTGNTVIDSLLNVVGKARKSDFPNKVLNFMPFLKLNSGLIPNIILVTGHRRENFGKGFENICFALRDIASSNPEVKIIYPVHLNPNIRKPVRRILSNIPNVHLIEPMDYLFFIKLMDISYLVLTDSGGIQEEAPSLGKPVIVMRDNTERPEALEAGTIKLVGTSKNNIVNTVNQLLTNNDEYQKMSKAHNPYGEGNSADVICKILEGEFL